MAKCACLSVDQVLEALEDTIDDDYVEDDEYEYDGEYEFDADECVMEGSDEEFGEFDDELRDQIEVDEMEEENVEEDCMNVSEGENPSEMEDSGEEEANGCDSALPTTWSKALKPLQIPSFTTPVGPLVPIPDTPVAIFEMFFTPNVLDDIVTHSNRYPQQVLGESYRKYRPLTQVEILAYFMFCMVMAIKHLPAI